jgi:hypothetical protein
VLHGTSNSNEKASGQWRHIFGAPPTNRFLPVPICRDVFARAAESAARPIRA